MTSPTHKSLESSFRKYVGYAPNMHVRIYMAFKPKFAYVGGGNGVVRPTPFSCAASSSSDATLKPECVDVLSCRDSHVPTLDSSSTLAAATAIAMPCDRRQRFRCSCPEPFPPCPRCSQASSTFGYRSSWRSSTSTRGCPQVIPQWS